MREMTKRVASTSQMENVPILYLAPGAGIYTRFVILGTRSDHHTGRRALWIADESGSATLALSGRHAPTPECVQEGEIFLLQNGEACLDRDGRIFLQLGSRGRLERAGFLTLAFEEDPDVSVQPWTGARARPEKGSLWQAKPDGAATASGGSTRQGNFCFLCDAEDHGVLDCEFLPSGVVIHSKQLDSQDKADRRKMLEDACEKANLAIPKKMRWYKKEGMAAGVMYMRMASAAAATKMLEAKVLPIGEETAKVFPITQREKRKQPNSKSTHDKGTYTAQTSSLPKKRRELQQDAVALVIKGSEALEQDALQSVLQEKGAKPLHINPVRDGCCRITLANAQQAEEIVRLAIQGDLYVNGEKVKAFPAKTSPTEKAEASLHCADVENRASGVPPNPAMKGGRGKGGKGEKKGKQGKGGKGEREGKRGKGGREKLHEIRKVCFLCGESSHELPDCPVRSECVLVCRDWGSATLPGTTASVDPKINDALCSKLKDDGYHMVRSYWHKAVCYMRLGDEQEVSRLVAAHGGQSNLNLQGDIFKVRVARSTRRTGVEEQEEVQNEEHEPGEASCPICPAGSEHTLASCPKRKKALRLRCAAFQDGQRQEAEAEVRLAANSSCGQNFSEVTWIGSAMYLTMESEEHALRFMEVAAGEGLDVSGEMVSVERLVDTTAAPSYRDLRNRTPGLRPEASGKGRSKGKRSSKGKGKRSKK